MLHLLQVCNVGQIVGGTAACAWTVTRSLPRVRHTVVFLGPVADETRRVLAPARVEQWDRVAARRVRQIGADVVLLHNTPRGRADERLPAVTVQYLHARLTPAPADRMLYCSHWLARQYGGDARAVCWQAVPRPLRPSCDRDRRPSTGPLVIGRLCTPQPQKWPAAVVPFYRSLAARCPDVCWEFVGCPATRHAELSAACGGRAVFLPASWQARCHLWRWDVLLYHNAAVTESFGRTVAEAMRAGCIPVVDDRGGFTEQIPADGGFLCRSPADFAAAVHRLHDPAERRHRSRAGQIHADQRFSLTRFAADLLRHFELGTG